MQKKISRNRRIAEQVKRDLAQIIQRQMKDDRLGLVTISGVEVSKDLVHAKVYITELSNNHQCVDYLNHAKSYLRYELGKQIKLRLIPVLAFYYDVSIDEGAKMDAIFERLNKNKADEVK